jgi:hypothetical protein
MQRKSIELGWEIPTCWDFLRVIFYFFCRYSAIFYSNVAPLMPSAYSSGWAFQFLPNRNGFGRDAWLARAKFHRSGVF